MFNRVDDPLQPIDGNAYLNHNSTGGYNTFCGIQNMSPSLGFRKTKNRYKN